MWNHGGMEVVKKINGVDKKQIAVGIGFLLCVLILLWRCFYSVNYADEPYCISSVWRFYKGDALLAQDWFPAQQLIAWILSPLYGMFRLFADSNDGIMLASRIAYVVFQVLVSAVVYVKLKNFGNYRIPAVFFYLLFTQNNMLTLNYNTVGLGCMLLMVTLLLAEPVTKKGSLILVGILNAIMVLSQPYAILMFLLWGVVVVLAMPWRKKFEIHTLLKFQTYFYVGLGSFFVLAAFVIVVLLRADISELQNGLQYLMSDPEHQMDLHYKVTKYFERFYRYYQYQILTMGICVFAGFLKENQVTKVLKTGCGFLAVLAAVYSLIYHGWISDYVPIDFICVPFTFLGISIWLLGKKKNKVMFFGWVIPAIVYTFCVQLTTNTGILAVSSACMVASMGGVLLIGETLKDVRGKWLIWLLVAVMLIQGGLLLYHRITATWWSEPVFECTQRLERGPAKGIYTSEEDAQWYYETLDAVDSLELTKEDVVLYLDLAPWLYLYTDLSAATYSTWTIGEDHFLDEYYECYPEKTPTVVCWMGIEDVHDAVAIQYFLEKGYEFIEIDGGIALRNNQ